ncbi:MAG: PAS domain-containing protein [Polyangiaceae bacterium]|nr:PAS domain-containing protein [Polyangiaceae bacterium]
MKVEESIGGEPRAGVAELERRVRELEEALRASEQAREEARDAQRILHAVMDHIPMAIFWKRRDLTYLGCNRRFAEDASLASPEEIAGKDDLDMIWRAQADLYRSDDRAVMDSGVPKLGYEELQEQANGRTAWVRTSKVPLRDERGEVVAVLGMYEDITAAKEAQAEQVLLREEVIRAQERALRELSAPLIPISDGAVALILIGTIDDDRSGRIMETLLDGIASRGAGIAIIDITGVREVGDGAARAIVQAAKAARLLGARVILTGVSPDVARAMVDLGADLGAMETLGTLQAGIESALRSRR